MSGYVSCLLMPKTCSSAPPIELTIMLDSWTKLSAADVACVLKVQANAACYWRYVSAAKN